MKTLSLVFALTFLATSSVAEQQVTTPISELKRGTMVTVSGKVERITDEDEFRLRDDSGSIRVYVGPNWVPANVGESVVVNGFVDDDWGPLEIYARSLTLKDGTVVAFERRDD